MADFGEMPRCLTAWEMTRCRDQFAYMTLMLCRHYAPTLEAPFKVYVFNLSDNPCRPRPV